MNFKINVVLFIVSKGLVENMASFVCLNCHEKTNLFGNEAQDWAKKVGVPLLGSVPLERCVMEGSDSGAPVTVIHPDSASSKVLASKAMFL